MNSKIDIINSEYSDFKIFTKYLIPCVTAMTLIAVYAFVDSFVVGQKLGPIALAALGIATPILMTAFALGYMFGVGGGSLFSISLGEKKYENSDKYFSTSFILTVIFGVTIAILGNIYIEEISIFLGSDSLSLPFVIEYSKCILWGYPFIMLNILMGCFMKNEGYPKIAMISTIIGAISNVILDFLFVYGFEMGMFGAGLATAICQSITFLINFSYSYYKKLRIRTKISNFHTPYILAIFKNGLSSFILESASGIETFVFIYFSTKFYSTIGASAYTIIQNWILIFISILMGITQAAQPLISFCYGAKLYSRMISFRKYSIIISTIYGVIFVILGYIFTEQFVTIFENTNKELLTISIFALKLYLPAFAMMGICICTAVYFQSINNNKYSLWLMLLRSLILPISLTIILSELFQEKGMWSSITITEFICTLISIWLIMRENRKMIK
ncbi:MAG: MATE family efflux transporter [Bacteroidales bacterium]|nr:MATE family efflux transporter [Bacteroidales bacterium]